MAGSIETSAGRAPTDVITGNVRVSVLGSLTVEVDGEPLHVAGTQRRRLMAVLASRAGRMVPVEAIIDALWLDDPPPTAAKTLQSHVVRLRKSLADAGGDVIETVPGGYRLALDPDAVDAVRFERLVADAQRAASAGDPARGAAALAAALELGRGPAYAEFREADFAVAEGARLDELRLVATEDLAALQLATGAAGAAVPALERLVRSEPGRERAWGLLMRALHAAGRQHEALDAYQRARRALAESFGLEPGPELRAIERDILAGDVTDAPAGRAVLAAALRSSTPMIGRTAERAALDAAWRAARDGAGQVRILQGPLDSGRTRLAADIAGRAVATAGDVEYARAADLVTTLVPRDDRRAFSVGAVVDVVAERARRQPLLLIVDDAEWSSEHTTEVLAALAQAVEQLAVLLVVVIDPTGGGPAVRAVQRLDPTGALTIDVAPMDGDDIAAIVMADGVDDDGVAAVVGVSSGLPGVARREAAAWCERTASDRLRNAAVNSVGATSLADKAQASVLDEVLELVAARSRRDELWSARWAGRQPYRALAAYEAQDADLFVGRERLLAELTARVLERRMVAVVGPSGSGKSSLARAGLVPLARSGRLPGGTPWNADVVVPGRDPVAALDSVAELDEPGPRLLVVDQFEEAFVALGPDVDRFTDRLVALAGDAALDVHVVIVIRSDEFPELASIAPLAALIERSQLLVGPPSDDELRRIVVEPARRTGVSVEPELVDLVVHDVGGDDASLPLLSAALAEVWERRDGGVLRASRYLEIGGLASSVERLGEQAVRRARSERDVRDVMVALADVTEEGVWTRRRLAANEVPDRLADAVHQLVEARLVVRTDTTVEVVHEVVFRAWPRLAAWLEEARGDLVLEREIRVAARAWEAFGRHDDGVYRGARLHAALEWQARLAEPPADLIVEFLDAGREHEEREGREVRERLRREQRARRRLARALVAAAILLVTAVVAAAVALVSQGRADDARREAEASAALAAERQDRAEKAEAAAEREEDRSRDARLVAESERLTRTQPDLALLLAVEAHDRIESPETESALITALGAFAPERTMERDVDHVTTPVLTNSSFLGFVRGADRRVSGMSLSRDGSTLAVSTQQSLTDGYVVMYDVASRRELSRVYVDDGMRGAIVNDDGSRVVAFTSTEIFLIDPLDGSVVQVADHVEAPATIAGVQFRRGYDQFLVVGGERLSLHDATTGRRLDIALPNATANIAGFGPDGMLAIGDIGYGSSTFDVDAGVELGRKQLEDPGAGGSSFLFTPDGSLLIGLVDYQDPNRSSMTVWDTTTGEMVGDPTHRPPGTMVYAVDPANASLLAVATIAGGVSFYDVRADTPVGSPLRGLGPAIVDLEYSGDGDVLVTLSADGAIALWGRATADGLIARASDLRRVELSGDGATALVTTAAGDLEARTGTAVEQAGRRIELPRHDEIVGLALSDDGSTGLVATSPPTLHAVDMATGAVRWSVPVDAVDDRLAISPDGSNGFVIDAEHMTLWDVATGEVLEQRLAEPPAGEGEFGHPRFVPEADLVVVPDGTYEYRIRFSDLRYVSRSFKVSWVDGQSVTVPGSNEAVGPRADGGLVRFVRSTANITVVSPAANVVPNSPLWVSGDGSLIAALDLATSTVSFFDAATLEPIGWPMAVSRDATSVEFTPSGDAAYVLGDGGRIVRITLDPADWSAAACRTAGRNLTHAEWSEYLGADEPYERTCDEWPAGT